MGSYWPSRGQGQGFQRGWIQQLDFDYEGFVSISRPHSLEDCSLTVAEMVPTNCSMPFHQLSNPKDTFFFVRAPAYPRLTH